MLTVAESKEWSINHYIETAQATERSTKDRARSGGGLGAYYSEQETRVPVWLCAGDDGRVTGLTEARRVRYEHRKCRPLLPLQKWVNGQNAAEKVFRVLVGRRDAKLQSLPS